MIRIEKEHYNGIARLLVECFLEDKLVAKQVKGIEKPEIFLEKLFLMQIPVYSKTCEIYSLEDDLRSVIVGYEKLKYSSFRALLLNIFFQFRLLHTISGSDLKMFSENGKEALEHVDLKWYREFIQGNYYYIKIIAIAKDCRERGIFRQLITPVINSCNQKSLPIILETNTPENVSIYQHFGFQLVKTVLEKETGFCQYCLVKQPD